MKWTLVVIAMSLIGPSFTRSQTAEAIQQQLVETVRFLNTSEFSYRFSKSGHDGGFASREELLRWLRETGRMKAAPELLSRQNPTPFELRISTSTDGQHYQIEVQSRRPSEMQDKANWCKPAAFSDERGVIFLGVALGCESPNKKSTQ